MVGTRQQSSFSHLQCAMHSLHEVVTLRDTSRERPRLPCQRNATDVRSRQSPKPATFMALNFSSTGALPLSFVAVSCLTRLRWLLSAGPPESNRWQGQCCHGRVRETAGRNVECAGGVGVARVCVSSHLRVCSCVSIWTQTKGTF